MPGRLYGYPIMGQFGLGHSMLAWARCTIWCHDTGATPLAPIWLRPRIGPILRRERDLRLYFRLFQDGPAVGHLPRTWVFATAGRICAETDLPAPGYVPPRDMVVMFTNPQASDDAMNQRAIAGRSDVVGPALLAITRPQFRPPPARDAHIALHIRGGDFAMAESLEQLRAGNHNLRLPTWWFARMLQGVRARLGADVPAVVYSDCRDDEIAEVLALANVRRSGFGEAITDMLAMAQARLIIPSGSNFSRWGAYLGGTPRISFPGQRLVRIHALPDGVDPEPEAETADDLPEAFIDLVRQRLAAPVV